LLAEFDAAFDARPRGDACAVLFERSHYLHLARCNRFLAAQTETPPSEVPPERRRQLRETAQTLRLQRALLYFPDSVRLPGGCYRTACLATLTRELRTDLFGRAFDIAVCLANVYHNFNSVFLAKGEFLNAALMHYLTEDPAEPRVVLARVVAPPALQRRFRRARRVRGADALRHGPPAVRAVRLRRLRVDVLLPAPRGVPFALRRA
jgi:hypothetical protein